MRNPTSKAAERSAARQAGKATLCCSKEGLKRGPWTAEEDRLLSSYIAREGGGRWRTLPKRAGLLRCGKSCRLRWMNYLRPSVKRGQIAPDEEDLILRLHWLLGNRWSLIAGRIPGRTDNEIKNYWNTHLSKKLISQGIDPRTHRPLPLESTPNCSPFPPAPEAIAPNPSSTSSSPAQELDVSGDRQRDGAKGVREVSCGGHLTGPGQFGRGGDSECWQDSEAMDMAAAMGLGYQDNWGVVAGERDDEMDCCGREMLSFLDSLLDEDMFLKQQQSSSATCDQYPHPEGLVDGTAAATPSAAGGGGEKSFQSGDEDVAGCLSSCQ